MGTERPRSDSNDWLARLASSAARSALARALASRRLKLALGRVVDRRDDRDSLHDADRGQRGFLHRVHLGCRDHVVAVRQKHEVVLPCGQASQFESGDHVAPCAPGITACAIFATLAKSFTSEYIRSQGVGTTLQASDQRNVRDRVAALRGREIREVLRISGDCADASGDRVVLAPPDDLLGG